MSKKSTNNKFDGKPKGAFYAIPMSSGYTLEISRPSATVAQAVLAKANEEHPYPEPPTNEITTVTGEVEAYPICTLDQVSELLRITDPEARKKANDEFLSEFSEDDQKVVKQYIVDLSAANSRQLEYMLDYILKRRATVEGVYGEEARQDLINAFSEDREELEEYGLVSDSLRELDDWQFVLQAFILADQEDYVLAMAAALDAMSAEVVTDTDVKDRIKSFRR